MIPRRSFLQSLLALAMLPFTRWVKAEPVIVKHSAAFDKISSMQGHTNSCEFMGFQPRTLRLMAMKTTRRVDGMNRTDYSWQFLIQINFEPPMIMVYDNRKCGLHPVRTSTLNDMLREYPAKINGVDFSQILDVPHEIVWEIPGVPMKDATLLVDVEWHDGKPNLVMPFY